MEFTGSLLTLKRNFYTQTGNLGFSLSCTVDNTTGLYLFGFSGAQGVLEFKLESGRLYYDNQFLHYYSTDEEFIVSAQFSSGSANILKDNTALIYGDPKGTGNYDYFYFTRANASLGGEFEVNISGDNSAIYTIQSQGYLLTTGQDAVTGYFINQSNYPIKIFDSDIQATANYNFGKLVSTIAAMGSGFFAYSGNYNEIDFSNPILTSFATNFGDTTVLFSIIDSRTLNRFVQLNSPSDVAFNTDNIYNREVTWLNYSGGFGGANFATQLTFQLHYNTGQQTFTGIWDVYTGNNINSLVSLQQKFTGWMSGSGFFPPNSGIAIQILYSGVSGNSARLVISGDEINNPFNQIINFSATG